MFVLLKIRAFDMILSYLAYISSLELDCFRGEPSLYPHYFGTQKSSYVAASADQGSTCQSDGSALEKRNPLAVTVIFLEGMLPFVYAGKVQLL